MQRVYRLFQTITHYIFREKIPILFFLLYFLIGIKLLPDYGVSWDEFYQEGIGQTNMQYILRTGDFLHSAAYGDNKYFGPFYELIIAGSRRLLAAFFPIFTDMGYAFTLFRHVCNFSTFFLGVIFFYLLCRHRFRNTYIALLGSLFLIFSPRLFSDAYYNSKDTVFLTFLVMTFYALIKYLEKKTVLRLIFLGIITGLSISVRVATLMVPLFMFIFLLTDYIFIKSSRTQYKKDLLLIVLYGEIVAFATILTYPVLYTDTIKNFLHILWLFSHFILDVQNLYFGHYVSALRLPWHYTPVWIAITTPPLYLLLFFIGSIRLWCHVRKNPKQFYFLHREDILFLLWFFLPFTAAIILRTPQFNSWRHMYFIYPALILIALHGLLSIQTLIQHHVTYKPATRLFTLLVLANLLFIGKTMADLHPYEHLYFNFLAGNNMNWIRNNFELDYWGLSYRKGLEYIIQHDKRKLINIEAETYPGWANSFILPDAERNRLFFVWPWDKTNPKSDYYITTFFLSREEPRYKELYSVYVRGAKIMSVYKVP